MGDDDQEAGDPPPAPPAQPWDDMPRAAWSADVLAKCGPWQEEGPRLVLRGECPVCDHDGIDEWLPLHPIAIAAGGRLAAPAEVVEPDADAPPAAPRKHEEFIWCQCTDDHPGRPDDEKRGCGARGRVEVTK